MDLLSALALLLGIGAGLAWQRERARRQAAEEGRRRDLDVQRGRLEEEQSRLERRTAALFDRMVEGVIVTDAAGHIRLANRAAGQLFGFVPPAAGRTVLEATRHHEVAAIVARLAHEPELIGQEVTLESATAPRQLQVNALGLQTAAGASDGALLVFHELTRLRRLEAVRQEFVANVSHELRTPLSLIKGATETLIDGGKNDPVALTRFLEIIDKHANRLALLIDDLLLLSALDSGHLSLELRPVPLRAAVAEVLEELDARARKRGIVAENAVPSGLWVQADGRRLHQVLSNLLDNAIKYGREGGRVVVATATLAEGRIEVAVRDDGPGLAAEAQARVFERFYRVDKARTRELGGTGLGLAIVKHLVQAQGGEVRVTSRPGEGAAFFFTLKAA